MTPPSNRPPPGSEKTWCSAFFSAENGSVRCEVCPHRCRLQEGDFGLCGVRRAENGRVVLTTYGRASSVAVDPIEKKPLYHFLPGAQALSIGSIGCNLSCRFCQNWTISKPDGDRALHINLTPEDLAAWAVREQIPCVAFTYNEPVVSLEFILDAARACRERGLRTVAVTNGYVRGEARRAFFDVMDAANVDLKAMRDSFYRRLCGARLEPVLDTLRYLRKETAVWIEVTSLLIPGENDEEDDLRLTADWCATHLGPETPLHFSAFFPMFQMNDRSPTDARKLVQARELARSEGMRHVYIGNVLGSEGSQTVCASCEALLIRRERFQVTENRVQPGGRCPSCGTPCAGIFPG